MAYARLKVRRPMSSGETGGRDRRLERAMSTAKIGALLVTGALYAAVNPVTTYGQTNALDAPTGDWIIAIALASEGRPRHTT